MTSEKLQSLAPYDLIIAETTAYQPHLDKILEDPTISNIALTGNFGVGKSSLLKTYCYQKTVNKNVKKKIHFLYLSLCDFSKSKASLDALDFERELLRQAASHAKKRDIPFSTVELIPEHKQNIRIFFSIALPCIAMCLFLILFPLDRIFDIPKLVFTCAYMLLAGLSAIVIFCWVYTLFPLFRWKGLSFDSNLAKVKLGAKGIGSLDKYGFELAYVLERISPQYDNVVVFEDMDRLKPEDCVTVCSKLRTINYIINERRGKSKKANRVKFIYPLSDKALSEFNSYIKFFDFILPLYPSLGIGNMLDQWKYQFIPFIGLEFNKNIEDFLTAAQNYKVYSLMDYRTIRTIQNEFLILKTVIEGRNPIVDTRPSEWTSFLIFVIYKVLFPYDYFRVRLNDSLLDISDPQDRSDRIDAYKAQEMADGIEELAKFKLLPVMLDPKYKLALVCAYCCGISNLWLFESASDHLSSLVDELKDKPESESQDNLIRDIHFWFFMKQGYGILYSEHKDTCEMEFLNWKKQINHIIKTALPQTTISSGNITFSSEQNAELKELASLLFTTAHQFVAVNQLVQFLQ